uniref:BPTI/Kunitz inhibitor domain-containing protein n=1 Tax=Amblyomma maculatum TaxID=34609 RepID=G3MPS4_AMBMU
MQYLYQDSCNACSPPYSTARVSDPCKFPISIGRHCYNDTRFVTRHKVFGYNYMTHRCERFTYLGCGGYKNRFSTAAECWQKCAGASGSKCVLKSVKRRFGGFSKYYYNMTSDTCESSRYWTNRVNGKNRFSTLADCERSCKANHTHIRDDV